MQCGAVQCSVMQCGAVQCSVVSCNEVQCAALQCGAVQCGAVQCGAFLVMLRFFVVSLSARKCANFFYLTFMTLFSFYQKRFSF